MSIGLESVIQVSGIAGERRQGVWALGVADVARLAGTVPDVLRVPLKDSRGEGRSFVPATRLFRRGRYWGVLAPEHSWAVVPGGNGMFLPTIVADGEVVGTWRRTVKAREILVEPMPFGPLSGPVREGLVEAASGYGAFLGKPARLSESGS
jgi:hypothetical protein